MLSVSVFYSIIDSSTFVSVFFSAFRLISIVTLKSNLSLFTIVKNHKFYSVKNY